MMKILIILSVCFVVTLGDPKDTAAVSTMLLSCIQPGSTFILYVPGIKSSKYLQEFGANQWNSGYEADGAEMRVVRSSNSQEQDLNSTRQNKEEEEVFIMTSTAMTTVYNEDYPSKLRLSYLECIEETYVDVKLVMQFKAGSWAEHPPILRWALCVLNKVNLMSLQGVYQYDTAMSRIRYEDKKEVDKILDRCLEPKPLPPQVIAWKYLKCINNEDRKKRFPFLSIFYTL